MKELPSLPTSIRERLEQARQITPHSEDDGLLRSAGTELARTNPSYAALIMAGQMGFEGIDHTTVEKVTTVHIVEHRVFGFKVSEEYIPLTNTRVSTTELRLVRQATAKAQVLLANKDDGQS